MTGAAPAPAPPVAVPGRPGRRSALALAAVLIVHLICGVVSSPALYALAPAVLGLFPQQKDTAYGLLVIGLIQNALMLLLVVLSIAGTALAILVLVRGRGLLRVGAGIALISLLGALVLFAVYLFSPVLLFAGDPYLVDPGAYETALMIGAVIAVVLAVGSVLAPALLVIGAYRGGRGRGARLAQASGSAGIHSE